MALLPRVSWLLIFTLFALPLIFFPWAYLAFELPKVFLIYLFSVIAVYLLLKSGLRIGFLNKLHYLYLIFLTWIIFSAILGLSFYQSFWGSYFRMQGILSWICYSVLFFISGKILSENHFKKTLSLAILISAASTAIFALVEFITLWFFGYNHQLLYSGRVISTFGQPNFLGAYLVMSLPFAFFLLKQVNTNWRVLIGFSIAVIILGIFSTLSRSAYLGLTILAVIWGIYHYRLLLAGVTVTILLFALLANLFPQLVYSQWYRFQLDSVSKWTAENRLEIFQKSIQLVLQNPITGYGIENISLAFPKVITVGDLGLKDIVVDSSHNLFLDLMLETGVVGLGLFIILISLSIFFGLKQLKTADKQSGDFIKAAICAVISFLVIHQFSVVSVVPMTIFWICMGIIGGSVLTHYVLSKKLEKVLNFAGVALIILTIFYIIQTIRAEVFFREASAYEAADIKRAINLNNEAIKIAPWVEFYSVRKNFLLKQLGYSE